MTGMTTPDQPPIIPGYQQPQPYAPILPPKRHTVRNVLLIVVAGLVALCGVGTIVAAATSSGKAGYQAAAGGAPSSPTAAAVPTVLNSPAQVIAALNHAGLSCGAESLVSNPANGAFAMSQCGPDVVISRYANPGAAAASRESLSAIMKDGGSTGYAVTFGNWLINAGKDQSYAQKVADLFHGTLTPIGGAKPSPTKPAVPAIDDGTWTVGVDFPAGIYSTTGTAGSDCYWEISKSGSNGADIIDNHLGGGHLRVTLKAGQDFDTERCGTWTKIG